MKIKRNVSKKNINVTKQKSNKRSKEQAKGCYGANWWGLVLMRLGLEKSLWPFPKVKEACSTSAL